MKNIIKMIKDEFKNELIDIDETEDEAMFYFEDECEIKVNKNKTIDVYKRYVYCDEDDEDMVAEQEETCRDYRKLLLIKFGEDSQVYDDSCIGCSAVDEIVGYFNKEFDIKFIRKFMDISQM